MLQLAWALAVFWLLVLLRRCPGALLRPSVWVTTAFLAQIGTAAAFAAIDESPLADETALRAWAVFLPVAVLVWVTLTPVTTARAASLYARCRAVNRQIHWAIDRPERRLIVGGGVFVSLVLASLLATVPLSETGIYAVFFEPELAEVAREETFKLLDSHWLKKGLTFSGDLVAPLVAVGVLLLRMPAAWGILVKPAVIGALLITSAPHGARSPVAMALLTLGISYLLRRGVRTGGVVLAASAVTALALAVILTVARIGELGSADSSRVRVIADAVFARAVVAPFETGVWTEAYVRSYGRTGFDSIGFPLRNRLGFGYVPLPNRVAAFRNPSGLDSEWMNTAWLFDYQASFGLPVGFALALISVMALDLLMRAFTRLRGPVLIMLLAVFYRNLLDFVSSAFTSVLFSGCVGAVVLAWFCSRAFGRQMVARAAEQPAVAVVR